MAVDKFKFISPGIFIDEIDESGLTSLPERLGPLVIGRFKKGPSMRPITVNSFKEFVQKFGTPSDGRPRGDVWRQGEMTAPTYAAYAAQAWLRNNTPCTIFRLLGEHPSNADSSISTAQAGWKTDNVPATTIGNGTTGGAYGLFVFPNPDSYVTGNAQATILVDNAEGSNLNIAADQTMILQATDGTKLTITAKTDSADYTAAEFNIVAANDSDNAANIVRAITGSTVGASHFTASRAGGEITVEQINSGPLGNTTLNLNNLANATASQNFSGGSHHAVTGTLAAIWYIQDGAMMLTGTDRLGSARRGAGALIKSTNQKFTAQIFRGGTGSANEVDTATFNFNRDSDLYIRKVFNTDPTKTNSDLVAAADLEYYWLGETFDENVRTKLAVTGSEVTDTGDFLGVILGLEGVTGEASFDYHDRRMNSKAATTGWFFSQDNRGDTSANFDVISHTNKLFKIHALDSGESANRDLKISVADIKVPTDKFNRFGTFSVLVRKGTDNDHKPEILERFSNVSLDPGATNYIAKVIGDRNFTYDSDAKVLREHGNYPNRSNYVRVEMDAAVDQGAGEGLHPYGVYGPLVPATFQLLSGSTPAGLTDNRALALKSYVTSTGSIPDAMLVKKVDNSSRHGDGLLIYQGDDSEFHDGVHLTASLQFPSTRLRVSSSEGDLVKKSLAFFGYNSSIVNTRRYDHTNLDLLRATPSGLNQGGDQDKTEKIHSWIFTLDDVKLNPDNANHSVYVSGSRAAGTSYTAKSGSSEVVSVQGHNKFTSPMFGGFDGFDVTEKDPFRNEYLSKNEAETTNYAYHTIKKAIDMVADEEFIEYDVATIPGVTRSKLTTALVNNCEERGDALAIIDVEGGYKPPHENSDSESTRLGNVTTTVSNLKELGINSSYGCAFYPFVQIRDVLNDSMLYVPPSVVALGTFSSSQRKSAVWFAPAGFTRGGLSEGSSGLTVTGVRQRLTSDDRDELYDANINPIASFPAEGVVIFGQKTLQVTPSALDRINVRRLLIYLKKEISRIAARILFDQNVQATWDKFTGQVEPFLAGVKAGLGLTDYRVVLDDTTTTPDLVDRNVLYAKIYLKPARAIEFIALDFIITKSGASFDD